MPKRFFSFIIVFAALASPQDWSLADESRASTSPAGNSSATLDFANGLYVRRMYTPAISEYEKFIKTNPGSPEIASAFFRVADSFYFSKDYASSITKFEAFIKNFPNDNRVPIAWFRIATAHYYLKQSAPAVKIFQRLAKDSKDPTVRGAALFYMGKSYEIKEKSGKSIEIFQKLLKEYPQNEFATYAAMALGDQYLGKKKYDEAIFAYQVAADRKMPVEMANEARFKIAEIHFYNKDYAKAKADYEKLLESSRGETDGTAEGLKKAKALKEKALMNLFYCDYQTHDFLSANKRLESEKAFIQETAHTAEAKYLIASILLDKKDTAGALKGFEEVLADPKTDPVTKEKTILKKAQGLALSGKKDAAFLLIQNLQNQKPTNAAMVNFEKGRLLKELGSFIESVAAFEAISDKDSGGYYKASLFELADAYVKTANPDKARETFERFIKLYPTDEEVSRAYLEIAQIDQTAGHYEKAIETLQAFIKERPKDEWMDVAYYRLGAAFASLDSYKEAFDAFQVVIREFPNSKLYAESIYGQAVTAENQGDAKHAIFLYEKFWRDTPNNPQSAEAVKRLGYLYIKADNFERAKAFYEDLLFNRPSVKVDTEGIFWLLQYYLDSAKFAEASKILGILPKRTVGQDLNHEINFFRGELSYGQKDYAKAIQYYSESLKMKPTGAYTPNATLGMGLSAVAISDLASAEKYLTEALKYDSEVKVTMRARFEIANLRLRAGKIQDASKAYMLVAILYDDEKYTPWALYQAGECFAKLNNFDEAHKAFAELKTHYPNSEWAKKIPS